MTIYEKVLALGPHFRALVEHSQEIDGGLRVLEAVAQELETKREEFVGLEAAVKERRREIAELDVKRADLLKALAELKARFA